MVNEVSAPKMPVTVAVHLGPKLRSRWAAGSELQGNFELLPVDSMEDLEHFLIGDPRALGIVAIDDPVHDLAYRLSSGEAPELALTGLEAEMGQLGSIHDKFRSRLAVIIGGERFGPKPQFHDSTLEPTVELLVSQFDRVHGPVDHLQGIAGDHTMMLVADYLTRAWDVRLPEVFARASATEAPDVFSRAQNFLKTEFSRRAKTSVQPGNLPNEEETSPQVEELKNFKEENSLLILRMRAADEEILRLREQSITDSDKIEALRRGRVSRQTKIAALERDLESQNEKLVALRRGRAARRETIKNLEAEVAVHRAEADAASRLAGDYQSQLEAARRELTQMKNSRTWKYVRLIRRVGGS